MALLTKEQILKADDMKVEVVSVPEWGGEVRVKSLTGMERDEFETSMVSQRGKNIERNFRNLRARLVVLTVVDEENKCIFSNADVELLGKKSGAALDRVYDVAQRLSGLKKEDVEELTKNSETTQREGSGSDSPSSGDAQ